MFNWALAKEQWNSPTEAIALIEKAIQMEDDPPYSVLKARLVRKNGDAEGGIRMATRALNRFAPVSSQDEFARHWYRIGARMTGDKKRLDQLETFERESTLAAGGHVQSAGEYVDVERAPGVADE